MTQTAAIPVARATLEVDVDAIERAARMILTAIGEDPTRPGLLDTPERFARWWQEFITHDAGNGDVTFEAISTDQLVCVRGMRVWSICEHHLLPFNCDVAVGYIAEDRVLGLSKFGRIARRCAHRLQIQERLVQQIADEISRITGSADVAVVGRGKHTCMSMRGVEMPAEMYTSVMLGRFRENSALRSEFLSLLGERK